MIRVEAPLSATACEGMIRVEAQTSIRIWV